MNSDSDVSDQGPRKTGGDDYAFVKTDVKVAPSIPQHPHNVPIKLKKAPDAPKRFKSAFIFFSTEKHKEIRSRMMAEGNSEKTVTIAKLVSEAWKSLSAEEKEKWETLARKDKARYEMEKTMYKGPWKVPAVKRSLKDPTAPKRPMSAFLAFSNSRRAMVKKQNHHMGNAEISKTLSTMWKEAPVDIRQKYIDQEFTKRQAYKIAMAGWRHKTSEGKRIERQLREESAIRRVEAAEQTINNELEEAADIARAFHASEEYISSLHQPLTMSNPSSSAYGTTEPFLSAFGSRRSSSASSSAMAPWNEQHHRDEKDDHDRTRESYNQSLASLFTTGNSPYLVTSALTPASSLRSPFESGVATHPHYNADAVAQRYDFLSTQLSQHASSNQASSAFQSMASYMNPGNPYSPSNAFASNLNWSSPQPSSMFANPSLGDNSVARGYNPSAQSSLSHLYQQSGLTNYGPSVASNPNQGRVVEEAAYDLATRLQRRAAEQRESIRQNLYYEDGSFPPGWNEDGTYPPGWNHPGRS